MESKVKPKPTSYQPHRVVVAVSGTIQDGFELRKNIDYRPASDGEGEVVKAVFLGWAVVRGVRMYFDVKDKETSREYDAKVPHRVNPAMVLTGNANDANRYAVYAVDERACLNALLGEPRLLTMAPDAVRIDLDDPLTSPDIASLARTMMARDDGSVFRTDQCAVLAVVACYKPKAFVPATPFLVREDGTRMTSFQESLALFAGIDGDGTIVPGSEEWNQAVAAALEAARVELNSRKRKRDDDGDATEKPAVAVTENNLRDDTLYGTSKSTFRLSKRITTDDFNEVAKSAGTSFKL